MDRFLILMILILIQLGPTAIATAIGHIDGSSRDRAVLLSFASGISSDPGRALANWGSPNVHMCNWTGIACDRTKHVVQLDLSERNLSGVISPVVSNLSFLSVLDLSDNSFRGKIPTELGALSRLTQLSMSSNLLEGSIPAELGLLRRLVYLDLGGNRLESSIPKSLFCNTSLQYIDLSNNSLGGEIPFDRQCRLLYLRFLLLWSNNLVGTIPRSLSNSSKLEWMDLESNFFSGGLPSDVFDKMPYLQFLYLSYNNLSFQSSNPNLDPFFTSLANCSHLQELELAGNGLGGEIPSSIGYLSTNLLQLHLEENRLHGPIPLNITNLVNLTYLNLSNNLLNRSVPPDISRMRKLERLYLSNNLLFGEIPPSLGEIPHLGLLDLSDNMLSGPIPDNLSNLTQLRRLMLQNNQLNGTISPSLGNCINLEILDLSYNRLIGRIPNDIVGLRGLKLYLNLSNNFLQGSLPMGLSKMDMILALDLSSNNLSGAIPPQLGSCIALEYLNLSGNALQGSLPSSIGALPYIKVLDLSSNRLAGTMPESLQASSSLKTLNLSFNSFSGIVLNEGAFSSLSLDSFRGNPGLCGSIAGMPSCSSKQVHRYKILPIILTLIGTSCLVCVIGYPLVIKSRTSSRSPISFRSVLEDSDEQMKRDYPRISYRQLVEATEGFSESNLIGSGRFGQVYKGILRDETRIAVKALYPKSGDDISGSFRRECEVLKRTKHRNLIKIITACIRPDFKALVLPLMLNGSLESHLYPRKAPNRGLSLIQLVSIASDIAEGMAYLHHYSPVRVIHCDLKPSNVLLDDDMTALVADFGIARLVKGGIGENNDTPDSSSPFYSTTGLLLCGSVGYIAPEYGLGGRPTIQGDIYSFGVLLLEIITGKRPTDVIFHEGLTLHEWVKSHYPHDIEPIIVHAHLSDSPVADIMFNRKLKRDVMVELIELGLVCTHYSPSVRPTMIDVAHELAVIKQDLSQHAITAIESASVPVPSF